MSNNQRGFTLVDPIEQIPPAPAAKELPKHQPEPKPEADSLTKALHQILSVTLLSQRAAIALAKLFTLLTVGSAFVLWYNVPEPSVTQIVSLAIYAVFVLAINAILLWRK